MHDQQCCVGQGQICGAAVRYAELCLRGFINDGNISTTRHNDRHDNLIIMIIMGDEEHACRLYLQQLKVSTGTQQTAIIATTNMNL